MSDTELLDLIPFFERLSQVDNVYTVLRNSNNAALSGRVDLANPNVDVNTIPIHVL